MDYGKKLRHVMYKHAQGSNRIKHRNFILNKFNKYTKADFSDREFRALVAEEPKIITCTKGYYILPKRDKSGNEAKSAILYLKETEAKACSLFRRVNKQVRAIHNMAYKKQLV